MTKKILFYLSIIIFIILNIILDLNINKYIKTLNNCFNQNIHLTTLNYIFICSIIALISIFYIIVIKLVVFYKKEEIKGIKFKNEDGTFGTANWLSDNDIDNILGKNNISGIILGKKNNDIIKLPFTSHFNKNICVFGSSGSMKTIRFFNYKPIRTTKIQKINYSN